MDQAKTLRLFANVYRRSLATTAPVDIMVAILAVLIVHALIPRGLASSDPSSIIAEIAPGG
jgi:hypothetical protein